MNFLDELNEFFGAATITANMTTGTDLNMPEISIPMGRLLTEDATATEDTISLDATSIPDDTLLNEFFVKAGVKDEGKREALYRALRFGGVLALGDLRQLSKQELLSLKGIGERSCSELVKIMSSNDIDCVFVRQGI